MASMTQELITILSNEQIQYDNLLRYANEKKDCLINNKLNELGDLTNKEQIIITELNRSEKKRKDIIESLGIVLNKDNITLSEIAKKLPESDKEALLKIKENLLNTVDKLKELNRQNTELITEGLNFTEYTLNAMQGPSRDNNSYANELNYERGKVTVRYFDSKR